MRLVVQRVEKASVTVEGKVTGEIGQGLLVLVAVHKDDLESAAAPLANKLVNLRIFADAEGKMNLSVKDVGGEVLAVSQFTLYGTCTKGRRPEFTQSAGGAQAEAIYNRFVAEIKKELGKVETGQFAAYMSVALVNDGPITLIMEG